MPVYKYLDTSTCHVSRKTMDLLESTCGTNTFGCTVAGYEFGAFVSVPGSKNEIDETKAPEDLKVVLNYARKKGCDVIRFDADADQVKGLPVFDW